MKNINTSVQQNECFYYRFEEYWIHYIMRMLDLFDEIYMVIVIVVMNLI